MACFLIHILLSTRYPMWNDWILFRDVKGYLKIIEDLINNEEKTVKLHGDEGFI